MYWQNPKIPEATQPTLLRLPTEAAIGVHSADELHPPTLMRGDVCLLQVALEDPQVVELDLAVGLLWCDDGWDKYRRAEVITLWVVSILLQPPTDVHQSVLEWRQH